jgi:hypothetical protein
MLQWGLILIWKWGDGTIAIVTGWWLSPTPLKNDGVKVSLDDDIANIWKNMFQTGQPG